MKRAPALHTHAKVRGVEGARLLKVLTLAEASRDVYPRNRILLWDADADASFAGSCALSAPRSGTIQISDVREAGVITAGDIVRLTGDRSLISVLYRRGANANRLFLTERCNSLCVMCSQPPRDVDDAWRIGELLETIELIDRDEPFLTLTGGEPALLGPHLETVLHRCGERLPNTELQVLTNGRLFGDSEATRAWVEAGSKRTRWAIPLYADVASVHEEIVGAEGAFEETLAGLYQLARLKARVEIRIVLHAMSVPRLRQLASYIYRRLPFVEHVAFMGLEPMGFTKGNRARLWIDPADYVEQLSDAVHHLAVRGMSPSIYNLPLCVLPADLRAFARQSISDWKNSTPAICAPCIAKNSCAGFFASAGLEWRSRNVSPILEPTHEMA